MQIMLENLQITNQQSDNRGKIKTSEQLVEAGTTDFLIKVMEKHETIAWRLKSICRITK